MRSSVFQFVLLLVLMWAVPVQAGGLIRDAEIEATLKDYAHPIFKAAGLKPSAINIYIVQDDSLNAFVAGGANLFIHTGMIMASTTPDMLLGVMAHETGHIAGGHLAKGGEKLKDAQLGTILSAVLGGAAAVASGKPEAAAVVFGGMGSTLQRNFLSFSRANENAADQAGISYLDRLGISASGMQEVFALLKRQERQRMGRPDPYLMTHPLTNDRIEVVAHHVEQSKIPKGAYPKAFTEKHARMLAKLEGFLWPPEKTLQKYSAGDASIAARMARAVAFFKQARVEEATHLLDSILKDRPNDAYIYDLKGQVLFESNRIDEAITAYRQAAKLMPSEPLIAVELAKAEIAKGDAANIAAATTRLEKATTQDSENSTAWHWLAVAYGKQGQQALSNLALAEKSLLTGEPDEALAQAVRAQSGLAANTPAARRADDVLKRARQMKKEKQDKDGPF